MKRACRVLYEPFHFAALLEALRNVQQHVQQLADKNYALLREDPFHPSLHFKKVGNKKHLWSVRVGEHYRALGLDKNEGVFWFWIGTHAEYDKILA